MRLRPGPWLTPLLAVAIVAGLGAPPLSAQTMAAQNPAPSAPADDEDAPPGKGTRVSGVDVIATKDYAHQIGAVVGDIVPEIQYSPADIQSFGVSTVTELLAELAPETRSDRGRGGEGPVVLLNGRRISGLNEVMNLPTEAILRVDILPEEVSLKYGYTANQRVVNIVTRRRFHATTGELAGGGATEGADATGQAELDLLHLRRDDRLNLDLKYKAASDITDADRNIVEPNGAPDGADRTLSPATQSLALNAVLARSAFDGIRATYNATLGATTSESLHGLGEAGLETPLHQYVTGWTAHLGSTFNKDVRDWRLSLTDAFDHADTQTDTDTDTGVDPAAPRGPSRSVARAISDSANLQFLANGPLLRLPAGILYVSAKAGDTQSWQGSTSTRFGQFRPVYLTRNDANAQLNLDLPLASRRNRVLPFLGDLSINANGAVDELSDFGLLETLGYGVNWTPFPGYNLIVSDTRDRAAPSTAQLGGPIVYTPGVPVFDYATGRTVEVTQISGGVAGLTADTRNVLKIGLTLKPVAGQDLTITANYIESDIDNPIATFPAASAEIQAAFPGRFIRDAEGDLIEEDIRPVNFARSERSEIRWGINYSRPIGKQPPPRPFGRGLFGGAGRAGAGGRAPGGEDGPSGGPGRFRGFTGPAAAGRLQFAVYHTLYLTDRTLVRPGGPTLDFLNGSPTSNTGGQYRNEIEAQLGMTMAGFGARLSADWREGTTVIAGPGSATGNLAFSGVTTINLRLFDTLGQQPWVVKRYPWLRGARVSLNVTNLLDQRVRVRDASGATPLAYQPGYLDAAGRTITLSVRKMFF
ncbi:MAG: TonB-dependent receptor [Caulobacteraceae bacterium]|nr:TonB-dependent receptor [Caulobacteraceae bacterium]